MRKLADGFVGASGGERRERGEEKKRREAADFSRLCFGDSHSLSLSQAEQPAQEAHPTRIISLNEQLVLCAAWRGSSLLERGSRATIRSRCLPQHSRACLEEATIEEPLEGKRRDLRKRSVERSNVWRADSEGTRTGTEWRGAIFHASSSLHQPVLLLLMKRVMLM